MTFEEVLDQAMAMLQRRGRVTYRTLQRQFQLDDAALDDLKDELLYTHPHIRDDAGRGLVWTGDPSPAPRPAAALRATPERPPLAYTPPYLAEKILTSRSALEGERKQVTVLFSERFGSINTVAASSRSWLCRCQAELGTFTEGLAMADEGLRIAETVNNPLSLIEACQMVSFLYLCRGDVHRAIPMLERAMGLCQDWHVPLFFPWIAAALGLAYTLAGSVAAGLALVEQGMEQEVARGRPRSLASVVTQLSEAYLLAGRLEEARQRAEQALDLARQYQLRGNQAWALWLLGESPTRQGSPEVGPAAGHYRQALALAEELGMRPLQAHCHLGLGTLYATIGRRAEARAELSAAIELYRAMDMTFWLPQAEATLARVEGQIG
jgi:tetratricopeptide (TPR) repeat protein